MNQKSFESLSPDMLFVLGDVSARGSYLPRSKWSSVVQQFQRTLGPFNSHPFHVLLGDRDVGECSKLNPISVRRMARISQGRIQLDVVPLKLATLALFHLTL